MIDGIIFDLDGTLWDARDVVAKSWSLAVEEMTGKSPNFTAEYLSPFFGKILPEIASSIFPNVPKERQLELINRCTEVENQVLLTTPGTLYPRLRDTLQALYKDYPLFIVSNCQAGYIEVFLETSGLSEYFTGHLCPDDTGNPKADNISAIKDKYKLKSPIYVGDTALDYASCVQSNTPFIFASYGFGNVKNPKISIASISELVEVVNSL